MRIMLMILVSGVLSDNFVLSKFLGICPFLGVSKKLDSAVGMGIAVTMVMLLATAATWPVYTLLLVPGYVYLRTLVFILIIAAIVQMVETVLKKHFQSLYRALGVYLPLITTNCAVLGVTLLNLESDYTFAQSLMNSFGAGMGFLLAMVLFAGVRSRMESGEVPKSFQGIPITLVAASIVSMAFMGFSGLIDGLFGYSL